MLKRKFDTVKESNFNCTLCGKSFQDRYKLKRHTNSHIGYTPHKCEIINCGKSFSEKYRLILHLMTHTKDFPFKCDACDNSFKTQSELKDHKNEHIGETPYKCDECSDQFTKQDALYRHKLRSHGNKRFSCQDCNLQFFYSYDLIRHIRTHTGEKNYICENCKQAFANSYGLTRHMLIHNDEKKESCDQCVYKCNSQYKLRIHKLRHTGIKTCSCDICGKLFMTKSEVAQHKISHSNTRNYKCSHCFFSTNWKQNLIIHENMHELQSSYPLPCKMQDGGDQLFIQGDIRCSIRCKTERDMEIHIQRNHTQEGLHNKLESEEKMAQFLKVNNIEFSRDWFNFINFKNCGNIDGNKQSARPDFFLLEESIRLGALVFLENDEFSHRVTSCDFQRVFNIVNSLQQTDELKDLPILFIRFNPHHYRKDGKYFDPPLKKSHEVMLSTLKSIEHIREGVHLIYINYDSTHGELDIFKDIENDYAKIYKDCVLLSI